MNGNISLNIQMKMFKKKKKHIKFTEDLNLGKLELKLLSMIKSENPKSIRDLALKAEKDPTM
ncbi:MAG: hypothetical protein FWH29_04400 [Methanobrevibacter sp.]|nr:hypothetical protein [Methanobrevibacter sp.]